MVLLVMILRKIVKNIWLVSCLLLGMIISVALISSIPLYAEGILQRFLTKELEEYQLKENKYTGLYQVYYGASDDDIREVVQELEKNKEPLFENKKVLEHYRRRLETFTAVNSFGKKHVEELIKLPVLARVVNYSIDVRKLVPAEASQTSNVEARFVRLQSMSGVEDHISLVDGRLPSKAPEGDVYEVLISEWALKKLNIVKDRVFKLEAPKNYGMDPIKIKPVGVFTVKPGKDPYWFSYNPQYYFNEVFLMDEGVMVKDFIERKPTLIYSARWTYIFDYHAITVKQLKDLLAAHNLIKQTLVSSDKFISMDTPAISVITRYVEKTERLKNMLLVLYVPVILMLFLYIFMISRLIIDRERNEIALLSSRGANRLQIVAGYFIEGLLLGGMAYLSGPWVGLGLSRILGSSNGFLEFARRKAITLNLSETVFIYAAAAVGVLIATMLIPAFAASKTSIVSHKQSLARRSGRAVWEMTFIDLLLILISAYGYYTFIQRQKTIRVTAASALEIQIDPLLFIVPTLFITGFALLFLRTYPYAVKAVYLAGRRFWPPSMYITLIQVGRQFKGYHFLVVFMIMTLSTGIFSATAARTINRNEEEKIRYGVGGDMVLESVWENDAPRGGGPSIGAEKEAESEKEEDFTFKRTNYLEPSFIPYTQLEGVALATKVFVNDEASVEFNAKYEENIKMMGIEPYEFGNIAWFRDGLLPHHLNEYLNLLIQEPSACLISRSLSEAQGIRPGDSLQLGWRGPEKATFTVYGILDYWPSWNPNKNSNDKEKHDPMLFVGNLSYIQNHLGIEPYQVWLKLKPDATSQQVYDSIKGKKISVTALTDAKQQLIESRKNPFLLAINGVLTLGFMICGVICFLGFLIYWVLSINSRVLQFGILRAMGLSVRKLISMIVWEQILTSGAAVVSGIFIGLVTSRIFVPFFQAAFDAYLQVPPFRVISYSSDRMKIYALVGITLLLGLGILGGMISGIKIDQAIKLGEE